MVRPKNQIVKTYAQQQQEQMDRINRESPVVATKWAVQEVKPGYNTGGYYDTDVPEYSRTVSPDFDTQEQAKEWMDEHVPDKGHYLVILKKVCRKYTHYQWSSVRTKWKSLG